MTATSPANLCFFFWVGSGRTLSQTLKHPNSTDSSPRTSYGASYGKKLSLLVNENQAIKDLSERNVRLSKFRFLESPSSDEPFILFTKLDTISISNHKSAGRRMSTKSGISTQNFQQPHGWGFDVGGLSFDRFREVPLSTHALLRHLHLWAHMFTVEITEPGL